MHTYTKESLHTQDNLKNSMSQAEWKENKVPLINFMSFVFLYLGNINHTYHFELLSVDYAQPSLSGIGSWSYLSLLFLLAYVMST